MPLLTVESGIDGISRIAQSGHELAVEVWIVLDDKEPQPAIPPFGAWDLKPS